MQVRMRHLQKICIALGVGLLIVFLLPSTTVAAPSIQSAPSVQCVQSLLLLFEGKLSEAKPQLGEAVTALRALPNPDLNSLGMCALFLGIVHHSTQDWVEALAAYDIALSSF